MLNVFRKALGASNQGVAARQAWRALALAVLWAAVPVTPAIAQWSTESALPTYLAVRGIAAPAPGRVFLATDDNSFDSSSGLFESSDGGQSWVQRDVPTNGSGGLNGIFFLDSQHGWVWGNVNYRTVDGGTSWEQLPLLGSAYSMTFSTTNFGIATGNFGAYFSWDGGLSWAPSPNDMKAFSFADAQTGLGVSASGIYRTTDGGATFTPVFTGASSAVQFLSATVAVAIVDGTFARSNDGGVTWTSGVSTQGRNRLVAVSSNVALAWGRSGTSPDFDDRIFRSADGGQSWTDLGEVIAADPYAAAFSFSTPNASTVIAGNGEGDIYRSTDAGLTWTQSYSSPGPRPGSLGNGAASFVDAQTGYAGFGAGFIILH